MAPRGRLPSGTVTFLFTDIEGSTDLLKRLGRDAYEGVLAEQAEVLRTATAAHGGRVVDTQGDSLFCAFRSAREAVAAATEAQHELAEHEWPEQVRVRVRMGLHSGEPKTGDKRYVGIDVHRAARIGSAAHGGQVLISETARALLSGDLPAGVSLRDLGVHRLKDIDEPLRLYQVVASGLQDRFPAPRTLPRGRSRRARLALLAAAVLVAVGAAVGALLATGSASAKPVRLHANSIAVFDPKTGKAVGDVPLGFSPTDVDAGGDRIWVLNAAAQTATAIDPGTLEVLQTVGVHGDPFSQYATGGTDWVGIPGGVDELSSGGATPLRLWKPPPLSGGSAGAGGSPCYSFVTGDGRSVWVAEGTHVAVLDAASGSLLRRLELPAVAGYPPGDSCYGLRYTDGELLAIRTDSSFGPVDLSSGTYTPVGTIPAGLSLVGFGSANWAAGFGSYWIGTYTVDAKTGNQVNVLDRLDPTGGGVTSQTVVARGAFMIDVDPSSGIWAVGGSFGSATLVHIDQATGRITRTIRLPHSPCCPSEGTVGNSVAVGHGRLWVVLDSP